VGLKIMSELPCAQNDYIANLLQLGITTFDSTKTSEIK
jgi:hypothetical protein